MTVQLDCDERVFVEYIESPKNKVEKESLLRWYKGKTLKQVISLADRVKAYFVGKNSQIQQQNEGYLKKWYRRWLDKTVSVVSFGKCTFKRVEYDLTSISLTIEKVVSAYEKALVREVSSNQYEEKHKEELRLSREGVIPGFARHSLTELAQKIGLPQKVQENYLLDVRLLAGHAQEIKRLYQETHYVFTHAQALDLSVVNEVIHELLRVFQKDVYHPLFLPFRLPAGEKPHKNIDEFFSERQPDSFVFSDEHYSRELISVDSFFWSTELEESALYFLLRGCNVNQFKKEEAAFDILHEIFARFISSPRIAMTLAQKVASLGARKKLESTIGTLYAICVPKSVIDNPKLNIAYRAHPYGKRCICFPRQHTQVLQSTQLDAPLRCQTGKLPQYRLLALRLLEEKGVRSFALNTLSKNVQNRYRDQIKQIIKECRFYKEILDLNAMMTSGEFEKKTREFQELLQSFQIDKFCVMELMHQKKEHIPSPLLFSMQNFIANT
jgi:hypothetical protein